ncbi:MAG: CAP domain-containing protein [Oligoflexales bacterium]|nr:CAP domain-containing protein [Oligoflexales bacterium]
MDSLNIDYYAWGEILYKGSGSYSTPQMAVDGWMGSPGHKKVIVNPVYTELGTGIYYCSSDKKTYYTVVYISR